MRGDILRRLRPAGPVGLALALFREETGRGSSRLRDGSAALPLLVVFLVVSAASCGAGTPGEAEAPEMQETTENAPSVEAEKDTTTSEAEPMRAAYYDDGLAGAPTASGEPYDPEGFTAAHPYLPFGTQLLVSYDVRRVVVTVNDRLPDGSDHDLDLSLAAARDIGLIDVGTAVVSAQVLETSAETSTANDRQT